MRTVQPFGCWLFASSSSLRSTFRCCPLAYFSFLSPSVSISVLLLSSSSRLAACTASRDSRPPKPHLLSPVREKGDKVFGERFARLLLRHGRPGLRRRLLPRRPRPPRRHGRRGHRPQVQRFCCCWLYVFLSFMLEVLLQFFALVSALRMLGSMSYKQLHLVSVLDVFTSSSYMQTIFTFSLSAFMT